MCVLPADPAAEAALMACAVASPYGARLAAERVSAADLAWPYHRKVFTAAIDLRNVPWTVDGRREHMVAQRAGVGTSLIERITEAALVLHDTDGWLARRVLDAAARRRLLAELIEAANALRSGATLAEVVPVIERCLAVARGERVGVLATGPERMAV